MSKVTVFQIPNGKWRENCYLVINNLKEVVIIDPGSDFDIINKKIVDSQLRPIAVINTHGHYDHIGAVKELLDTYIIEFYLHQNDSKLMSQANIYKILFDSKKEVKIPRNANYFSLQDEEFKINSFVFKIIHTPGHTEGSVCFIIGDNLFTGDTLLPNGPGRTDLPGGNKEKLQDSLTKLRNLTPNLTVYPGHGCSFKLGIFLGKFDDSR